MTFFDPNSYKSSMSDAEADDPRSSDELIFQHLGAAVMLCWDELSSETQARILTQTRDVIGLARVPRAHDQVMALLRRHRKI
jgi:hypothetical protein